MKSQNMIVKVHNVTPGEEKYVVAREVEGEFWYYGRWDDEDQAGEVAMDIGNGVVLEDIENKLDEIKKYIEWTEEAKKGLNETQILSAEAVGYEHIRKVLENG